jgi:hypothetical protein
MQPISPAGFSYPAGATLSPDRAGLIADGRVDELCPAHEVTVAAYLAAESIHDLVSRARPEQSVAGLAVTAAAWVFTPGLAITKRRTGQALGHHVHTESS